MNWRFQNLGIAKNKWKSWYGPTKLNDDEATFQTWWPMQLRQSHAPSTQVWPSISNARSCQYCKHCHFCNIWNLIFSFRAFALKLSCPFQKKRCPMDVIFAIFAAIHRSIKFALMQKKNWRSRRWNEKLCFALFCRRNQTSRHLVCCVSFISSFTDYKELDYGIQLLHLKYKFVLHT